MQKLFLSVILSFLLALTFVAVKRAFGSTPANGITMVASGAPPAPIPWERAK